MRQTHTVTPILTMEPMTLHHTRKPFTLRIGPRIHILSLLEPIGLNTLTNRQKTRLILNPELKDMALRRDPVGTEMPQQRVGHVAGVFPAGADLYGEVAVLLAGFVGDDFNAVELQDGAGDALAAFGVEEGGHALFDADGAGAEGERVGLAAEGGGRRGFEDGQAGVVVEAAGFGGVEGANAECADGDVWHGQWSVPEGLGELEQLPRESWRHGWGFG